MIQSMDASSPTKRYLVRSSVSMLLVLGQGGPDRRESNAAMVLEVRGAREQGIGHEFTRECPPLAVSHMLHGRKAKLLGHSR